MKENEATITLRPRQPLQSLHPPPTESMSIRKEKRPELNCGAPYASIGVSGASAVPLDAMGCSPSTSLLGLRGGPLGP